MDGTGVELSESPAAHPNDTNPRSGEPSVSFDLRTIAKSLDSGISELKGYLA